jgi:segregation and condensation protein B
METLSIIAYKQPVTKAEIEKIRGVKSDHAVNKLIEFNLVYEVGRLNQPGRPALFATTEDFLRRFGVSSLDDLPSLNPDVAEEIKEQVDEEVLDVMGPEKNDNQEITSDEPENGENDGTDIAD